MLPIMLRTTLIIGMVCYFILLLIFLKRKSLLLKYALLWVFAGIFLSSMVIFPNLLLWIKEIFGMESNMNALFVMILNRLDICFSHVLWLEWFGVVLGWL